MEKRTILSFLLRRITKVLIISAIIIIIVFGTRIFKRYYFNEFHYRVPDLTHHNVRNAQKIVDKNHLRLRDMGEEFSKLPVGQIFLQEPQAGSVVKINRPIKVWTSMGAPLVEVENLVGMNFLEAKSILSEKGLEIDKIIYVSKNIPYNEVIATDPATDSLLRVGSKVSFLINSNDDRAKINMPDLIGYTLDEAIEKLENSSLTIGKISSTNIKDMESGIVIETSVSKDKKVAVGESIDLIISN